MRHSFWMVGVLVAGCSQPHAPEASSTSSASLPIPSTTEPVASSEPTATVGATASALPSAAPFANSPTAPPESPPPGFSPLPKRRKGGFPGVAFKKVKAFAFDLDVHEMPVCEKPLAEDGRLCSTVSRPGVELTDDQTKRLLALMKQPSTFGGGSKCFLPHHGFVFYDEADVPVAELSFCFMCEMAIALPAIPVAKESGEGEGMVGVSEKGTKAMRALCTELGLPKCDAKTPKDFGGRD